MTGLRLTLVVAVARNGVIGAHGQLPWRLKSDLRRFRALTMGKPVVMGRKTFLSIGKPLDGRDNVVVATWPGFAPEGIHVAADLPAALRLAESLAAKRGADEICVIGGGTVFAATLPQADRLLLTEVDAEPEGDVWFPPIPAGEWVEITRETLPRAEGDTADAVLVTLERRRR